MLIFVARECQTHMCMNKPMHTHAHIHRHTHARARTHMHKHACAHAFSTHTYLSEHRHTHAYVCHSQVPTDSVTFHSVQELLRGVVQELEMLALTKDPDLQGKTRLRPGWVCWVEPWRERWGGGGASHHAVRNLGRAAVCNRVKA